MMRMQFASLEDRQDRAMDVADHSQKEVGYTLIALLTAYLLGMGCQIAQNEENTVAYTGSLYPEMLFVCFNILLVEVETMTEDRHAKVDDHVFDSL